MKKVVPRAEFLIVRFNLELDSRQSGYIKKRIYQISYYYVYSDVTTCTFSDAGLNAATLSLARRFFSAAIWILALLFSEKRKS
jgi:hypothetical protein